jgi:hypothetical protein
LRQFCPRREQAARGTATARATASTARGGKEGHRRRKGRPSILSPPRHRVRRRPYTKEENFGRGTPEVRRTSCTSRPSASARALALATARGRRTELRREDGEEAMTQDFAARRRMVRAAAATAGHCARCGHALAPGAPVWRQRTSYPIAPFRLVYTVAPFCERCGKPKGKPTTARPCEGCGRPVHHVPSWCNPYAPPPRHALCSRACRRRQQSAVARARRAKARSATRACACCGEHFESKRADAVFCSGACRQKAYRRRVTADECLAGETIDSRNGVARAGTEP